MFTSSTAKIFPPIFFILPILLSSFPKVIFFIASSFISRNIAKSLNNFKDGLQSFFDYLNRKSDKILALDDSSTNEFGTMAKLVNQNIDITKESIIQDNRVINEAQIVMNRVSNGWYSQLIEANTINQPLNDFKNNVNSMIVTTKERFKKIDEILFNLKSSLCEQFGTAR